MKILRRQRHQNILRVTEMEKYVSGSLGKKTFKNFDVNWKWKHIMQTVLYVSDWEVAT